MPPRPARTNRYDVAMARQVAARAPLAFAVFLTCVALSTSFEILRFPARRSWMLGFAAGFLLLTVIAWRLIRTHSARSAQVLVAFVGVVGIALNAYHAIVGAPVAMCVWTLTGLLAGSAVIVPWRPRHQMLASAGTLLSYPVHLMVGNADALVWGAGATYLLIVAVLAVFASALLTSYARSDLELTAALAEREMRLQSYFDLALVGTAILSAKGRCVEVNDELCRMLGYDRNDLLGRPWIDVVASDDGAAAAALLARATDPKATPEQRELRCLKNDRAPVDVIVSVRGLPGAGGVIDHTMVLVHDITERKRAEVARERAKNEFLAAVSHELRTPLSSILAWSALIGGGRLGAEQTRTRARYRPAQRASAGGADRRPARRLARAHQRVAARPPGDRARTDRPRRGRDRACDRDDRGHRPRDGDPLRPRRGARRRATLQQVVWNLLANAVKFTPRGGRVRVALARAGALAQIVVRDTGRGISQEFLPEVFDLFRQATITGQERRSFGVGLAIVRSLVERHGGTVRAESAGEGQGPSSRSSCRRWTATDREPARPRSPKRLR